jgi:hypothetical protein
MGSEFRISNFELRSSVNIVRRSKIEVRAMPPLLIIHPYSDNPALEPWKQLPVPVARHGRES